MQRWRMVAICLGIQLWAIKLAGNHTLVVLRVVHQCGGVAVVRQSPGRVKLLVLWDPHVCDLPYVLSGLSHALALVSPAGADRACCVVCQLRLELIAICTVLPMWMVL